MSDQDIIEIGCEHVIREISNYIDGEITLELRARLEEHIRGCKHCAAVLDGTTTPYACWRMAGPSVISSNCPAASPSACSSGSPQARKVHKPPTAARTASALPHNINLLRRGRTHL
jgi:anti-sigma factor RsiW